jgi:hypothetical protein
MAITIGSAPTDAPTGSGAFLNATTSKPKTIKNYYILGQSAVFDSITTTEPWTFKASMVGPNTDVVTASTADQAGWNVTNVDTVYTANEIDTVNISAIKIPT